MNYTEDLKKQLENQFIEWVAENKFKELEDWCAGDRIFNKDTYEDCLENYIDENVDNLWEEYFNQTIR
jgi:hypothetical protein